MTCPELTDKELDEIISKPVVADWRIRGDFRKPPEMASVDLAGSKCGLRRKPQTCAKDEDEDLRDVEKVPGVVWHARVKRWQARINEDGVRHHLGYYRTKEEAVLVRKAAERSLNRS